MSHNISCKMNCSLDQVTSTVVKSILEKDFKWKILPKGEYRGYYGSERAVEHDIRIALPASQAPAYGQTISPAEAKQFGVPEGYKIIAVKGNEPQIVKQKNEMGIMEEVEQPAGITVTMDQGNRGGTDVKEIQRKIEMAVQGAQVISNVMDGLAALREDGTQLSVSEDQVRAQIAASIIANTPMSVDINFG